MLVDIVLDMEDISRESQNLQGNIEWVIVLLWLVVRKTVSVEAIALVQ